LIFVPVCVKAAAGGFQDLADFAYFKGTR